MKKENDYQSELIDRIQELIPRAIILKNDANYKQGIPDLSIFLGNRWAWLEVKKSPYEPHQPNQDYYIGYASACGFGAFIDPINEAEVLRQLLSYFK